MTEKMTRAQAWRAYKEAIAPAEKAYDEAVAQALKACEEARAQALKAYDEAIAPALKAYDEALRARQYGKGGSMGEIVLSWVHCNGCKKGFPVVAKDDPYSSGRDEEYINSVNNLEEAPKYCPLCGSTNLSFDDLNTEYYG